MAFIHYEGWRFRGGATELGLDYTIAGAGTITVGELTARRAGCYAATLVTKTVDRVIALTSGARVITEFAVKWVSGAGTIVHFMEGATTHCSLGITSGGVLRVYRGDASGTQLGTDGSTLVSGTVYHLTVDMTVHDTTGATTIFLNDVAEANLTTTSVDTQNGGTTTINAIRLEGNAGGITFADWCVIDPSNSAGRTTKVGSGGRADCRIAIANGSKADFLPNAGTNYQAVDDNGHDGDATYNASQVAGARDLFTVTQMSHNPAVVYAIMINLVARKADSASRSVKPVLRSPTGSTIPGSTTALTTSYAAARTIYEPSGAYDDGAASTQQAFNSRQFGYEIV